MRRPLASLLVFAGIMAVLVPLFLRIPGGFLPDEDQGVLEVQGFGFGGRGQNSGLMFVKLKGWAVRRRPRRGSGCGRS